MTHIPMLALAGLLLAGAVPAVAEVAPAKEPDVGWCCFYPFVDVASDQLATSGASILSVCSGGWGMGQVEGKLDFGPFDRQLAYAREHGLKLALIQELNPVYTPAWLRDKVKAAGENVRSAAGQEGAFPSISSGVFRRAQEDLVRQFSAHLREADPGHTVAYSHPGAEWWFPLNERYHPKDVARFRQWLAARYRTIDRLNAAWGAGFPRFEDVPAPEIDMMGGDKGRTGMATVLSLDSGGQHCSWSTPAAIDPQAAPGAETYVAVEPGKQYVLSAWVRCQDVAGFGVFLEVAWVRPAGGPPIAIDTAERAWGTGDWRHLSAAFTAPKDAGRAWILLKLMGTGTVTWDDVDFRLAGTDRNLAPNPGTEAGGEEPAAWRFQNWSGGKRVESRCLKAGGRSGGACLQVTVPPADPSARPYRSLDAAVHDWSTFWYEAGADYINGMARLVKRHDPSRPTVTYLTFSFAYPAEWDYTQRYAIAPDEVAARGRDIDAFGMQICAADGDAYRVTACLDLVRKYGKPMWAVDLVDFTSGVYIGYPAMDRITQAAVQHGAAGIIYCAWHMPTVLDYSFHPNMAPEDQQRMLGDARRAIKLLDGLRVEPRGALVQPILPASPTDPEGYKNDPRSFIGWYKLLESLHQTFDVVTLRELELGRVDLRRYSYLLVPDCAWLPEAALSRLSTYALQGGTVVTGGRFGQRSAVGTPLRGRRPRRLALPDYGRAYCGDPVRDTHAGNTPPLFIWRKETPATRRGFREGRPALRRALEGADAVPELLPDDPSVGSVGSDRSVGSVRSVRWAGKGVRAVYLVNAGTHPVPAGRLKLRVGRQAGRVEVYADTHPAACEVRRGVIALPGFRSGCIVKLSARPASDW